MLLSCTYTLKYNMQQTDRICRKKVYDYQNGFRTNTGPIDNILILRQVIVKVYEYNIQIDTLFINFKQAIYSIILYYIMLYYIILIILSLRILTY